MGWRCVWEDGVHGFHSSGKEAVFQCVGVGADVPNSLCPGRMGSAAIQQALV